MRSWSAWKGEPTVAETSEGTPFELVASPVQFDEQPTPSVLAGAAIIVASGLLIVWREASAGVSRNRPFLRTRNARASSAPPMRPAESDEEQDVRP